MWSRSWVRGLVAAGTAAVAMASGGCGDDDESPIVRPPTPGGLPPAATTTTGVAPAPTAGQPTPGAGQSVLVTPSTGLRSGQVVKVTGRGFSPNQALVVNQCADKGKQTGPGDCNLTALTQTVSDASGNVSVDFTVEKGPFGANAIDCAAQRCLISVNQAAFSPTEQADTVIHFD